VSRDRSLRDLALAVTQLTVLTLPVRWPDDEKPDVASHYVWAGFVVGAAAYGPLKLVELVSGSANPYPGLIAALVIAGWGAFTRLRHWDGLAGVGDGWFGVDPGARRAIASESHVGAFGAMAVLLVALIEYAALTIILEHHEMVLLVMPAFSRCAATFAAWLGHPAKPTGLGAAVVRKPGVRGAISATLGMLVATFLMTWGHHLHGLVQALVALVLAAIVPHLVAKRFGGVTGDVMGASVLLVETVLFVMAAVVG